MKLPILSLIALGITPSASAAVLIADFEEPTYTTGNIAGQDGWSNNASGGGQSVVTTTSSGLYTGGQGLQGNTYLGAKSSILAGNQIQYDFHFQTATSSSERVSAGFWLDDGDATFQASEFGASGGLISGATFGVRGANYGTEFGSGVSPTAGTWYQVLLSYDDLTSSVTMDVIDLTNGGAVVDLDPGGAGSSFTHTFTSQYGGPVSDADGIGVRSSGNYTMDNIYSVPEPSIAVLGLLGMAGLLRRRVG